MGRSRHRRRFIYIRLALLAVFLLASLIFHPRGTTLVVLQIVRVVLVVAFIVSSRVMSRGSADA